MRNEGTGLDSRMWYRRDRDACDIVGHTTTTQQHASRAIYLSAASASRLFKYFFLVRTSFVDYLRALFLGIGDARHRLWYTLFYCLTHISYNSISNQCTSNTERLN